jgi:signal transduction histidine kinase
MKEYRLTILFAVVGSLTAGIATLMVHSRTGDMTTTITTEGLLTGFLAFVLAADVMITRSNLRQRDREVEAAKLEYLQESRRRIVAVEEGVRKDIALQLHGSVQNTVVLLMHRLKDLEQSAPPELAAELADLQNDYGEALADHIRSITHRLYPSILRYGLVPALQSLADTFQETLDVDLEFDEAFVRLEKEDHGLIPEQVRLAAYRIAEEALGNVVKHSNAKGVTIRPELISGGRFRLTVRDDGEGFEVGDTSLGLGLTAMRDYAEATGGERIVRSAPGTGTEVVATFPVPDVPSGRPETPST